MRAGLRAERGAVLILVVMVTVVLTLLGLGVLSLGTMESSAALDGLRTRQAAAAAEAGLRAVKHWFDAPAGSAGAWLVPTAAQVDRMQRALDHDGDGTFAPRSSLPAPWNVLYRQGRDDLFDRPYRDGPALEFAGDSRGPDIVIARDSANGAVRDFAQRLSIALFPEGPAPNLVLEIGRIAVFGPPTIVTGGARVRVGIASIEVTGLVVRRIGGAETVLATARASGVLQEIPWEIPGPLVAGSVEDGSGLDLRWGSVLVAGPANVGADPASCYGGGWPWRSWERRLVVDADLDGTGDDTDADGALDFDEWLALADPGLSDPWFRLLAGGSLAGSASTDRQPYPFDPSCLPGGCLRGDDRSGLFQDSQAAIGTLANPFALASPSAPILRAAAADGGGAAHLFRYVPGTDPPLFREGACLPCSLEEATRGKEGLFYFDTVDGLPPRDSNGDGAFDNLTPPIVVADPDWWARGCLVVNAQSLTMGPSSRAMAGEIEPPGEPFDDLDGDGACGETETFLRLQYPFDPLAAGAAFSVLGAGVCGAGASARADGPGISAPLTFAGLLIAAGDWSGPSSARLFGALEVNGAVTAPARSGARTLQVLYDQRLGKGAWPPPTSPLPRTVWQGRSVAP